MKLTPARIFLPLIIDIQLITFLLQVINTDRPRANDLFDYKTSSKPSKHRLNIAASCDRSSVNLDNPGRFRSKKISTNINTVEAEIFIFEFKC